MDRNEWRLFKMQQGWKGEQGTDQAIQAFLQRLGGLTIAVLKEMTPHDANAAVWRAKNVLNSVKPPPPAVIVQEPQSARKFHGKVPPKPNSDGEY